MRCLEGGARVLDILLIHPPLISNRTFPRPHLLHATSRRYPANIPPPPWLEGHVGKVKTTSRSDSQTSVAHPSSRGSRMIDKPSDQTW